MATPATPENCVKMREWLSKAGADSHENERLVDLVCEKMAKQGVNDSNYNAFVVCMPQHVEELIAECQMSFAEKQYLRSCFARREKLEMDVLSVECLAGEGRGQYVFVYEIIINKDNIITGCSRGDGLDSGHALKPGQTRMDVTPKDVRLAFPHFGVGDAQTVGVEILCYEIDNREQTAMLKKSFGMYQDEEFKESRIPWDKVEMGLKMASPYIPDFMGLKAGLNLVSEVPTVMKMLAKADKNDLVGKMSIDLRVRRSTDALLYEWKMPNSLHEQAAMHLKNLRYYRHQTIQMAADEGRRQAIPDFSPDSSAASSLRGSRKAKKKAAAESTSAEPAMVVATSLSGQDAAAAAAGSSNGAVDQRNVPVAPTKNVVLRKKNVAKTLKDLDNVEGGPGSDGSKKGKKQKKKKIAPSNENVTLGSFPQIPELQAQYVIDGKEDSYGEKLVVVQSSGLVVEHMFVSEKRRTKIKARFLFSMVMA